ncbi:MAG: hypothetical protein MI824_16940 [Hyphomicrobiales bacterium]|nr:hypothetical protein [Hyphomicrobiales bacterium]
MTSTVTQLPELLDHVAARLPEDTSHLIGIDGIDGVGKTPTAKFLSAALKAQHLELDKHLIGNMDGYTQHIRCEELATAVRSAAGPIVIDGVCLLAVAERCGLTLDTHIYVKCINESGRWDDERYCLALKPVEEFVQIHEQLRQAYARERGLNPPGPVEPLFVEIAEYNRDYRPVEKADLHFELDKRRVRELRQLTTQGD